MRTTWKNRYGQTVVCRGASVHTQGRVAFSYDLVVRCDDGSWQLYTFSRSDQRENFIYSLNNSRPYKRISKKSA